MAMTCRGILALPYANRLRLVAGASGGGNEIRWVHILEEPQVHRLAEGGRAYPPVRGGHRGPGGGFAVPAPGPL